MTQNIAATDIAIEESEQQNALLAWATHNIEVLSSQSVGREFLHNALDWLAHYTREHFGFQQRLMREASYDAHFITRLEAYNDFRRTLTGLCLDIMRCDPTVSKRLCAFCHELLADAQNHDGLFFEFVRTRKIPLNPRQKDRPGPLVVGASRVFQASDAADAAADTAVGSSTRAAVKRTRARKRAAH